MGFTSNDGSCQQPQVGSSRNQADTNCTRCFNLSKNGLRSHYMGVDRKDNNAILSESDIEDVDFKKQFYCSEGLSDESECMWLSSDSMSASLLSSDDLQLPDVLDTDLCDVSLCDRFSNMLTVSGSHGILFDSSRRLSIFDGCRVNHIEEASLVLDRTQEGVGGEDLKAKEELKWLKSSDGNKVKDSSTGYSDCVESAYERSLCEDSSVFYGSWTSLSTLDEPSPYYDWDFDRMDFWISLLDLEGEDSELASDRGQGLIDLESDFPSPSYNAQRNLRIRFSNLSFHPLSEQLPDSETMPGSSNSSFGLPSEQVFDAKSPPEDSETDEPLFWPFDRNSYWRPEFEGNYLCVSPLANGLKIRSPISLHGSKSVRFRLHQRNDPSLRKKNIHEGYKGKILFSSRSAPLTVVDRKTIDTNKCFPKVGKRPSRLSKSTQVSSDKSACNISMKKGHLQLKDVKHKPDVNQKDSSTQSFLAFESGYFQNYMADGVPIEMLVGLNEFDGHEGINKELAELDRGIN